MAITFDAAAGLKNTSASSISFSHTVANQNNRIILVSVDTGATISSVTYAGVNLTQLATDSAQSGGEVLSLWYLLAPATGANNVVITLASSSYVIGSSVSYYGVAQSSTFGTAATNGNVTGGSSMTNTVTTTSSSQLVIDCCNNTNGSTDTPTASQTKREQPATSGSAIGDIVATGTSMTLTWSSTGGGWAQISVPMSPAIGGAAHLLISDGFGGVFS